VKILVEISCGDYDSLLDRVTEESPVYPTLKNAVKILSTEAGRPPEMIMSAKRTRPHLFSGFRKNFALRRHPKSKSQSIYHGQYSSRGQSLGRTEWQGQGCAELKEEVAGLRTILLANYRITDSITSLA
jgi:hypothetical protein